MEITTTLKKLIELQKTSDFSKDAINYLKYITKPEIDRYGNQTASGVIRELDEPIPLLYILQATAHPRQFVEIPGGDHHKKIREDIGSVSIGAFLESFEAAEPVDKAIEIFCKIAIQLGIDTSSIYHRWFSKDEKLWSALRSCKNLLKLRDINALQELIKQEQNIELLIDLHKFSYDYRSEEELFYSRDYGKNIICYAVETSMRCVLTIIKMFLHMYKDGVPLGITKENTDMVIDIYNLTMSAHFHGGNPIYSSTYNGNCVHFSYICQQFLMFKDL